MLRYFIASFALVATVASADDTLELQTQLEGNDCVVTNDQEFAVTVTRVKFYYICQDAITRRAPLRTDDLLAPEESNSYTFPGPDGGCLNPFVTSCKAEAERAAKR